MSDNTTQTAWLSKDWMDGVRQITVETRKNDPYSFEVTTGANFGWRRGFKWGRDIHITREAAVADAEKRRAAKIASLEKQIKAARAVRFEEGEAA